MNLCIKIYNKNEMKWNCDSVTWSFPQQGWVSRPGTWTSQAAGWRTSTVWWRRVAGCPGWNPHWCTRTWHWWSWSVQSGPRRCCLARLSPGLKDKVNQWREIYGEKEMCVCVCVCVCGWVGGWVGGCVWGGGGGGGGVSKHTEYSDNKCCEMVDQWTEITH